MIQITNRISNSNTKFLYNMTVIYIVTVIFFNIFLIQIAILQSIKSLKSTFTFLGIQLMRIFINMCLFLNFPQVEFNTQINDYVIDNLDYFFHYKDICVLLDGFFNVLVVLTGSYSHQEITLVTACMYYLTAVTAILYPKNVKNLVVTAFLQSIVLSTTIYILSQNKKFAIILFNVCFSMIIYYYLIQHLDQQPVIFQSRLHDNEESIQKLFADSLKICVTKASQTLNGFCCTIFFHNDNNIERQAIFSQIINNIMLEQGMRFISFTTKYISFIIPQDNHNYKFHCDSASFAIHVLNNIKTIAQLFNLDVGIAMEQDIFKICPTLSNCANHIYYEKSVPRTRQVASTVINKIIMILPRTNFGQIQLNTQMNNYMSHAADLAQEIPQYTFTNYKIIANCKCVEITLLHDAHKYFNQRIFIKNKIKSEELIDIVMTGFQQQSEQKTGLKKEQLISYAFGTTISATKSLNTMSTNSTESLVCIEECQKVPYVVLKRIQSNKMSNLRKSSTMVYDQTINLKLMSALQQLKNTINSDKIFSSIQKQHPHYYNIEIINPFHLIPYTLCMNCLMLEYVYYKMLIQDREDQQITVTLLGQRVTYIMFFKYYAIVMLLGALFQTLAALPFIQKLLKVNYTKQYEKYLYTLSITINRYICMLCSWIAMETYVINVQILKQYKESYSIMMRFLPFTWTMVMFITFVIYMMLNVTINNPVMFSYNLKIIVFLILNTMFSLFKVNVTTSISFIMIFAIVLPILFSWQVTQIQNELDQIKLLENIQQQLSYSENDQEYYSLQGQVLQRAKYLSLVQRVLIPNVNITYYKQSKAIQMKDFGSECDERLNVMILHRIVMNMISIHQFMPLLDFGVSVYVCLQHTGNSTKQHSEGQAGTVAQLFQQSNIKSAQADSFKVTEGQTLNVLGIYSGIGIPRKCDHGCIELKKIREKLLETVPGLRAVSSDVGMEEFYGSPNEIRPLQLIRVLHEASQNYGVQIGMGVGKLNGTPLGSVNMVLRLTGAAPMKIKAFFDGYPGVSSGVLCLASEDAFRFLRRGPCRWRARTEHFLQVID